jgi:hypothetical protein
VPSERSALWSSLVLWVAVAPCKFSAPRASARPIASCPLGTMAGAWCGVAMVCVLSECEFVGGEEAQVG